MRIKIKVIPHASKSEVMVSNEMEWKIKVQASPLDGKANEEVIRLLAQYFRLPRSCVRIIAGEKSHRKVIEVFGLSNEDTLNK